MKATQKLLLFKSFFAVFLLFVVYGCQTTNNTVTSEPPVSELTSGKTHSNVEYMEDIVPQAGTAVKEAETTEDVAIEKAKREKDLMEQFSKRFLGMIGAHGGVSQKAPNEKEIADREKPKDGLAVKSEAGEERPFIELEKKLYGKWINKKETESYDFHDDGTVLISEFSQRGVRFRINGNYKLVEEERIRIDSLNDPKFDQLPPRYFKISISENEFALTDEPKKKGEPDGPTTKYKRVE